MDKWDVLFCLWVGGHVCAMFAWRALHKRVIDFEHTAERSIFLIEGLVDQKASLTKVISGLRIILNKTEEEMTISKARLVQLEERVKTLELGKNRFD